MFAVEENPDQYSGQRHARLSKFETGFANHTFASPATAFSLHGSLLQLLGKMSSLLLAKKLMKGSMTL